MDDTIICDALPSPVVTATDSCDGSVAVTLQQTLPTTPCTGTMTRVWTAQDTCGNIVTSTHNYNLLPTCSGSSPSVYINELVTTPEGSGYVELRGTPNFNLSGYAIFTVNGYPTAKGLVNFFAALNNYKLGPNGLLIIKASGCCSVEQTPSIDTVVVTDAGNLPYYNTITLFLVSNWTGTATPITFSPPNTDFDLDNDGVFETPLWSKVEDTV